MARSFNSLVNRTDASSPRDSMKDALVQSRNFVKPSTASSQASTYSKTILLPRMSETTLEASSSEDEACRISDDDYAAPANPSEQNATSQKGLPAKSLSKHLKCAICSRRFSYGRSLHQHQKMSMFPEASLVP